MPEGSQGAGAKRPTGAGHPRGVGQAGPRAFVDRAGGMGGPMTMRAASMGRYEVRRELGRGGFSVVHEAWDPQVQRPVALKAIREDRARSSADLADLRQRFTWAARAAGRLRHRHIVLIFDVIQVGGAPVLVMEYLPGGSLAERLKGGPPLPVATVLTLLHQACEALAFAHGHRVFHRGLKPTNLLLGADGSLKVGDFGMAQVAEGTKGDVSLLLGTPAYMAPEQLRGQAPDARSDVFSLGAVAFELLTGQRPFRGVTPESIRHRILHEAPVSLREVKAAIPPALDEVIRMALAKDPAARFPDAKAFAKALGVDRWAR